MTRAPLSAPQGNSAEPAREPKATQLHEAYAALPTPPPLPFEPVDLEWHHGVGNPDEGPNPTCEHKPALPQIVRTPHLVLLPDTPLWYECRADTPDPSVLRITGDDGVQLFVDGRRLRSLGPSLFPLPAGRNQTLTIRVVNNAQHGGLLTIGRATLARYESWKENTALRERLDRVFHKLSSLAIPVPAAFSTASASVLAAIETTSAANLSAAESALARWPVFRVQPFLQDPTRDQMTIVWETDTPGDAILEWDIMASPAAAPTLTRPASHRLSVTSPDGLFTAILHHLPPDRLVSYRIRQYETTSDVFTFATRATAPEFQFTVWGDIQGGLATFKGLLKLMDQDRPAFTVGVGDLVGNGSLLPRWHEFFAAIHPLASSAPFFLMPGNHDYDGNYDDFTPLLFNRYARRGGQSTYCAWTWGNVRFIALDPNDTFPISIPPASTQHAWLMCELASEAWRSADWRFVLVHQPCYSAGKPDGYDGDRRIRDLLDPLAESAGIDFIISGHTHNYERLRIAHSGGGGTHHLVVGGAGAPLTSPHDSPATIAMDVLLREHHFGRFRVSGKRIEFEMINCAGRRQDGFVITKEPPHAN